MSRAFTANKTKERDAYAETNRNERAAYPGEIYDFP